MARTRNMKSNAAHRLRSGRKFDASDQTTMANSSSSSSGGKKKNPQAAKNVGKNKNDQVFGTVQVHAFDGANNDAYGEENEHGSDGEHSSENPEGEESEEGSGDYHPTEIGQKHATQKANSKVATLTATSNTSQHGPKSATTKHTKTSAVPASASNTAKVACVLCSNAHVKCAASAMPGQPCQRCVKMGLRCVVDPNHKRGDPLRDNEGEETMAAPADVPNTGTPIATNCTTTTATNNNDMLAAPGTPAYRYSATKVLLLLKHAEQRSTGGSNRDEIESVRQRAIALWHEVNMELADDEETFDAGGLEFLKGLGRH